LHCFHFNPLLDGLIKKGTIIAAWPVDHIGAIDTTDKAGAKQPGAGGFAHTE